MWQWVLLTLGVFTINVFLSYCIQEGWGKLLPALLVWQIGTFASMGIVLALPVSNDNINGLGLLALVPQVGVAFLAVFIVIVANKLLNASEVLQAIVGVFSKENIILLFSYVCRALLSPIRAWGRLEEIVDG